jgi:AbrB family looped-hinge helix DNA binding protein
MPTLTVSSKGQIVLPAGTRRRLGLAAGAQLEATEVPGGIHLRVVRSVKKSDVEGLAGMVKLQASGKPRRLEDFDASRVLAKAGHGAR